MRQTISQQQFAAQDTASFRPGDTTQLLLRSQRGDPQAIGILLTRYQPRLQRIVHRHLGSGLRGHVEWDDVVQATNAIFLRHIADAKIEHERALFRFLARIAINQIRDAHDYHHAERRDVRRTVRLDGDGCTWDDVPADQQHPNESAFQREVRRLLDAEVERLPDAQRRVVELRDYRGKTWQQISVALDRSVPAAKQLHQRAWHALRKNLEPCLCGRAA